MTDNSTTFLGTERYIRYVFRESKMLSYALYDTLSSSLLVVFHNGSHYEYYGVDQSTFDELIAATSAGTYFSTVIRKFNCQRIK